jgi:hypothetical protein
VLQIRVMFASESRSDRIRFSNTGEYENYKKKKNNTRAGLHHVDAASGINLDPASSPASTLSHGKPTLS